jgi:hypothetical protein
MIALASSTVGGPSWHIIAGIAIFTTALIAWTRRRGARRPLNPRAAARNLTTETRERRAAGSDLRELMLGIEQTAREITAQLDTRFHKLEAAIRDADRRIAELRRTAGAAPTDSTPILRQRLDVVIGDGDELSAEANAAEEAPSALTDGREPAMVADFERVRALAEQKLASRDIAATVHRPLDEVELMLAVRGRQPARPANRPSDRAAVD